MPSQTRMLTASQARQLITEWAFSEVSGNRVGVEIEWFTTPSAPPPTVRELHTLLDPLLPLPSGSALTFEPGAQVELSSRPFLTCAEAADAVAVDTDAVRRTLASSGIGLMGVGLDPHRPLLLRTDEPRYVAMKRYWNGDGPAGARMMCTTAAVHVNVDAGADEVGARRWHAAHRLGPTFVAAFANSPIVDGRPSGWMSSRMAAWMVIDPTRAAPADDGGAHPGVAWASYALNANVMFIRAGEGFEPLPAPFPFAKWIELGHDLGFPTEDDLAYHLTTLFPPVRPKGWLELRMIDMLPEPWWRVPPAVATALLYDDEAAERAEAASRAVGRMWKEGARYGLHHPALAESARTCFAAALPALDRVGCDPLTKDLVAEFVERYVSLNRCPADDNTAEPRGKAAV